MRIVDCLADCWNSVLSQSTSLLTLSSWLKRLSSLPQAAEGMGSHLDTIKRAAYCSAAAQQLITITQQHVFYEAPEVVFSTCVYCQSELTYDHTICGSVCEIRTHESYTQGQRSFVPFIAQTTPS